MFRPNQEHPVTQAGKESLLRSEIRFWRELIESLGPDSQPREAIERMHQALALAEYRLAKLGQKSESH